MYMKYIQADISHVNFIAALAVQLWDSHSLEERVSDFTKEIQNKNSAIFLCCDNGYFIGFAQFSLRFDYVEGTENRPVGYVEGIYVQEQYRKLGIAKALIAMGETWASEKGCSQIASDCELTNTDSYHFHLNSGFSEANRIICFVKDINTNQAGTISE
jgi:aminoglycoside 6'-N-acetyltransferase I